MADGPSIVEMNESDWVTPEERRDAEELARFMAKEAAASRGSAPGGRSAGTPARDKWGRIIITDGRRRTTWASTNDFVRPGELGAAADYGEMQLQTCFSDLFLALCAYWATAMFYDEHNGSALLAAAGFYAIAVAALCGIVRFTGYIPWIAIRVHDTLSNVAALTGLPLIALSALFSTEVSISVPQWWSVTVYVFGVALALSVLAPRLAKQAGGWASQGAGAAVVLKALLVPAAYGSVGLWCTANLLVGVALAVLSGIFMTRDRRNQIMWGDIWLGVDAFHYLLGLALLFLGMGIRQAHALSVHLNPLLLAYVPFLR